MSLNKQEQLIRLNKKMLACSQCVLRPPRVDDASPRVEAGETCTQVVPGEGPAEAEIMFIGEGPGQKEDELGRPFVGAAGKFLDEMLENINLKREEVYIANVVKCRPPGNRDPLPEEVESCWPWLLEQIKIIDPKLIVTLGKHSLERFLPAQKISQIHGKALRREIPGVGKRILYALYHPAAALYNGAMRGVLISDFKKIPAVLEAAKKPKEFPVINSPGFETEVDKQERLF